MAHGVLREFDPLKESIEDFRERFDFYCLVNNIRGEGDTASRKQALFLTLLGQSAFAKLKTLASPTSINDLTLDQIMEHLIGHYKPQTIEIAERFKFFKRHQLGGESTTDFMTELRRLAKTCNFGNYLELAIRDQFVCGLRDIKTQRELLCISDLTVQIALRKARAAETVYKETQTMKDGTCSAETVSISTAKVCYRCGKTDHGAATCKYKSAKCHACQKIGHLARVCRAKNKNNRVTRTDSKQANVDIKKVKVYHIETVPSKTDMRGADDFKRKQGTLGIRGPKGLAGSAENPGAYGQTGPVGATGLPNARGPHGRSGAADAPGHGGSTGATGVQGHLRPDEFVGPVGNPGVQGTLGTKGTKEPTSGKVPDGLPGGPGQSSLLSQKGTRVDCGDLGVAGEQGASIPVKPQGTQDQPGSTEATRLKGIHGAVGQAEYQGAAGAIEHKMQIVAEQSVGEHQPRKFKGQSIALRDYRPNATANWRQAIVVHQMGPLTYEVKVDGQVRSAHIDHLKPWPVDSIHTPEPLSSEPLAEETSTTQSDSDVTASFLIPATEDTEQDTTHSTATSRPQHSRRPPRQLIEEIT